MTATAKKAGYIKSANLLSYYKTMPIAAPAASWGLLGKMMIVVNYNMLLRGHGQLTMSKFIGVLLAHFTAALGNDIERDFNEVVKRVNQEALPLFFSPDQLDAIASCAPHELSDLLRIYWNNHSGGARRAAKKAIRRIAGRPDSPHAKPLGFPSEIRKRCGGASPETYEWVKGALKDIG